MTNYIEAMMRTAGMKKECIYNFRTENNNIVALDKKQHLIDLITHCKCKGKVIKTTMTPMPYYPDFTAEKQLEIIKLIGNRNQHIIITQGLVDGKIGFIICKDSKNGGLMVCNQDFTQALAQFTTELMKAGELDKQKVKEILEK